MGTALRNGLRGMGLAGMLFMLSVLLTGTASAADPTVPEQPGAPSLRVVNLDTIEVNWNKPADGGEEILRYLLEYHRMGDDFSISRVISEDEVRPIRISDLHAESTYSFRDFRGKPPWGWAVLGGNYRPANTGGDPVRRNHY